MKKYLLLLFVGVCSLLVFNACSGDDDVDPRSPEGIKKALVGVWETSMSSSNWSTIYIMPNGNLKYSYVTKERLKKYTYNEKTGIYSYVWEDESGRYYMEYDPTPDARWTFDEGTNSIYMYTEDGYYQFTYKVVMSDDQQSWVGTDGNGRTYVFTKIEE